MPYLDEVPVAERLDALASALGRVHEQWSAASFDILADTHPLLAVHAVCSALESRGYAGPAGVRRLIKAGLRPLELLDPAQRSAAIPRIAAATAAVTAA